MSKYIIALIETEDATNELTTVNSISFVRNIQLVKGVRSVECMPLYSDTKIGEQCLAMIKKILDDSAFAQRDTFEKERLECFKIDVQNVLEEENLTPKIPEEELLDIYDAFYDRINNCDRYWDIYWDTLRSVLLKYGYEPEGEE